MLSNFQVCINAVLPLLFMLLIGFFARQIRLLTLQEVHRMNHFVFVIFFPVLMFHNLYTSDLGSVFNAKLVLFGVFGVLGIVGLTTLLVTRIEKNPKSQGAMIQAVYRGNFILMGLPIAINLYGEGNVAPVVLLIAFIVPLYNVLAVAILESFRGGKVNWRRMPYKLATNPIIFGAVVGIVFKLAHLPVAAPILAVTGNMAGATTLIAVIFLGASFDIKSVGENRWQLWFCILGRLVVAPALCLSLAVLLGFRDIELVGLLCMFATPIAIASYTMADAMDSNAELAGNSVIFSTPLSCVTLFLWLFLFKSLGLF